MPRVELGALLRKYNLYEDRRAVAALRMLRRGASRIGLQVVPKTFYSAIPDIDALPDGTFERRSPLVGLTLDLDRQLEWASAELSEPMREFDPPATSADSAYTLGTPTYPLLDATVLYGVMRALRPKRVVELGSGASTLVTAQALRANARDGDSAALEVFDPYPGVVHEGLAGLTLLDRRRAEDLPIETFESLTSGDVLFVDTTHTVKIGSDVNFVVLDVLPRLAPGVVVHFHDIFLPYEYPRKWMEDFGLYWAEQYLLQAFLSMNAGYEVMLAVTALKRERGERFGEILPPGRISGPGAAFWLRRTE
jgi:predicted O-methyltransferase YrrM